MPRCSVDILTEVCWVQLCGRVHTNLWIQIVILGCQCEVVIRVKMLKSELRRRSSTAGTDIEYNWNANIEIAERKNGKQQDLEKNKERSEVPQDALLCNKIDSKKGSRKDIEPAQNLIERRLRLYMNRDEVVRANRELY